MSDLRRDAIWNFLSGIKYSSRVSFCTKLIAVPISVEQYSQFDIEFKQVCSFVFRQEVGKFDVRDFNFIIWLAKHLVMSGNGGIIVEQKYQEVDAYGNYLRIKKGARVKINGHTVILARTIALVKNKFGDLDLFLETKKKLSSGEKVADALGRGTFKVVKASWLLNGGFNIASPIPMVTIIETRGQYSENNNVEQIAKKLATAKRANLFAIPCYIGELKSTLPAWKGKRKYWWIDTRALCSLATFMQKDAFYAAGIVESLSIQLLQQVVILHKNGITHRDLKPENLLIYKNAQNSGYTLKITDFNNGFVHGESMDDYGRVGSFQYAPPEKIHFLKSAPDAIHLAYQVAKFPPSIIAFNPPGDMWAVGLILGKMFTGNNLYMLDIYKREIDDIGSLSSEHKEYIKRFLLPDADKRITAATALTDIYKLPGYSQFLPEVPEGWYASPVRSVASLTALQDMDAEDAEDTEDRGGNVLLSQKSSPQAISDILSPEASGRSVENVAELSAACPDIIPEQIARDILRLDAEVVFPQVKNILSQQPQTFHEVVKYLLTNSGEQQLAELFFYGQCIERPILKWIFNIELSFTEEIVETDLLVVKYIAASFAVIADIVEILVKTPCGKKLLIEAIDSCEEYYYIMTLKLAMSIEDKDIVSLENILRIIHVGAGIIRPTAVALVQRAEAVIAAQQETISLNSRKLGFK